MNELKDFFYSLKSNESRGYDDVSYNVTKKCFDSLREPLKYLFNLLIGKGVFPDDLKIARVTTIYKGEDSSDSKTNICTAFQKFLSAKCIIVYTNTWSKIIFYIVNNLLSKTVFQLVVL